MDNSGSKNGHNGEAGEPVSKVPCVLCPVSQCRCVGMGISQEYVHTIRAAHNRRLDAGGRGADSRRRQAVDNLTEAWATSQPANK